MNKPVNRTATYVIGFVVGILGILAAVIFGLLAVDDAKELGLWIASILGTSAAGVATAHRPTKSPTD